MKKIPFVTIATVDEDSSEIPLEKIRMMLREKFIEMYFYEPIKHIDEAVEYILTGKIPAVKSDQ